MNLDFGILKNKIINRIDIHDDKIFFIINEDEKYLMYHEQDCCEIVSINDISGEIDWLIDSPVLLAEERSNSGGDQDHCGTFTWTFYEIATFKGAVTITWYGESNGYYRESVDFIRIVEDDKDKNELHEYLMKRLDDLNNFYKEFNKNE